ncbi:MAG: RNA polymerase sigma factor [Xanthomonadales bacterium]|nr:RNA polymerase sigma factor [Xanthomonadales bacterium]
MTAFMDRPPEDASSTDEALMLAFRDGDHRAFQLLYERHRGPLFRFLLGSVGEHATAEELFQDTWMRLVDARQRYRVKARFTTYLYRIAQNRLIDHYRAKRPTERIDPEDGRYGATTESSGPAAAPEREQSLIAMHRAIAALPLEQRTAFLLRNAQDLSLEEIATITGVGRETVKSRLRYALNKLRAALGGIYGPVA